MQKGIGAGWYSKLRGKDNPYIKVVFKETSEKTRIFDICKI